MKARVVVSVSLFVVVLTVASFIPGRAQEAGTPGQQPPANGAPPPANPLQVALLKWYKINLTTTFKVPENPLGVVFDGENIWMCTNATGPDKVVKLRASDGADLGTFDVGFGAMGMAFDGANVWVANSLSNTVTKLRARDGKVLSTFKTGGAMPWFLAFDGQNIWVTNEGEATISELRASDGTLIGKYRDKLGVAGIAFDGTYMWVTSFASPVVTRYRLDGTQAGTFKVGLSPMNMAFDGANMWVANNGEQSVTKIRASDGKLLGTFNTGNALGPYGIAFDGQNLWISGGPYIVEMRPSDGKLLLQEELTGSLGAVGFDGANIWVAGYAANVAYKL